MKLLFTPPLRTDAAQWKARLDELKLGYSIVLAENDEAVRPSCQTQMLYSVGYHRTVYRSPNDCVGCKAHRQGQHAVSITAN